MVIPVSWLFICLALYSLSPRQFHPTVSPPSFSLLSSPAASLSPPVFPCLPPTLASPSFILLSVGFSLLVIPHAYLSFFSPFFLPCLPLALKHYLCLSFVFCLTSLCSFCSLLLPHLSLVHFSHLSHLFLAPFIFVLTFLLFLYTHPSLRLFFSSQFFLILIFPRSLSQFHLLPWLSSIFTFLPLVFLIPFSLFPPPIPPTPLILLPFTDCFLTDLSLLVSPPLSSFSSSLFVELHS